MDSRIDVGVTSVVVGLLWATGLVGVGIHVLQLWPEHGFGALGCALLIGAHQLSTRAQLREMSARERAAFEIGREAGRAGAATPLR